MEAEEQKCQATFARCGRTLRRIIPTSNKHKNFKSDVGPQIDKFVKATDEVDKIAAELAKEASDMFKQAMSITAALKGYEQIVKQLKTQDKTIEADFRNLGFDDFGHSGWVARYSWVKEITMAFRRS